MNILLLRQKEENDKYHLRFQSSLVHNVTSIPVLTFEFYNLDAVQNFIENIDDYSGLIFTSKRAIAAFQQTVNDKQLQKLKELKDFHIYVVGHSSEDCLRKLGLSSIGADSGNAKELSGLIIKERKGVTKPLMFLCGNLARETIPTRLTDNQIPNKNIPCYKTAPDKDFEENLLKYLKNLQPDVVVFFSPSGAQFHLQKIKELIPDLNGLNIVAIGESTKDSIVKLGQDVAGVAEKPTPDGLFEVIGNILRINQFD